jgi:hypothetical protein
MRLFVIRFSSFIMSPNLSYVPDWWYVKTSGLFGTAVVFTRLGNLFLIGESGGA